MLSVGGNNYRPPLERSKSAPKLMAIEEAEDDDEEREEEPYKRYAHVGSVGRRSWLHRTSFSVVEAPEEDEDECGASGLSKEEEGHEIDEAIQESSFKLTPSISRFEEDVDEEDEEGDGEQREHCDKETDGLEGEIMSYFEKKLNERSGDAEHVMRNKSLDTDDIISHLIRNQPPPSRKSATSSLTSPAAASEPDEPEGLRYQLEDLDSDADSDQPRLSPSIESDDSTTTHSHRHYPGKGIQFTQFSEESPLELDLVKKGYPHSTDSDSDVSDESGFIEYQHQDHKYPINADINRADNSILV